MLWQNEKRVLNSSDSFFSCPVCHLDNSHSSHLTTRTPTSSCLAPAWPYFSEHNFLYIILLRTDSLCTSVSLFQHQEICLALDLSLYASCCSFLQSIENTFLYLQTLINPRIFLRIEPDSQGFFSIMWKNMALKKSETIVS